MVLLDYNHLGDITISGNIYIRWIDILETRDSVLSSIHIGLHTGDEKYGIQSSRIETVTNITIHQITKSINYYTIL